MKEPDVYEQPFSEKVRTWLRAEMLFAQFEHFLSQPSRWDARAAIQALLDLQPVLSRVDIKTEMIADLERQQSMLLRFRDNPGVDGQRLDHVLKKVESVRLLLMTQEKSRLPSDTLHDPLLSAVRQRAYIPGGTCDFDLPFYAWWLNQSDKYRKEMLCAWLNQWAVQREATRLLLHLLRESAERRRLVATSGYYQLDLDGTSSCQLIRVFLPRQSACYPEISGGRQRFTIRFLSPQHPGARPKQTHKDVPFELACCTLA